jgi:hypothetical protein
MRVLLEAVRVILRPGECLSTIRELFDSIRGLEKSDFEA